MERIETSLADVWLVRPHILSDSRGFFYESYSERTMADIGIKDRFVQDNHSRSQRGVLRGLHYQRRHVQSKLVRVTLGAVFDVAVDLRRDSPTFGCWAGAELSAENRLLMYIPTGFAHGFLVLSQVAEVQYKCSDFYAPDEERGISWDDPRIGIKWPLDGLEPILSSRDRSWCNLDQMDEDDLPILTP